MGKNPGRQAKTAGRVSVEKGEPAPGPEPARPKVQRRPIWSGAISIGLVNVPVRVFSMIRDVSFSFRLLHKADGQPLKYERVCTRDGVVVPWEETVKGYEVRKDEYVVFEKSELAAIAPESDRIIRIDKFVHYLSLDPIYFDTPYILAPDRSHAAYALLLTAFQELSQAGVGKITLRTKEYPVVIHPYRGGLVMTTLRYAEEVTAPGSLEDLSVLPAPTGKELDLARRIITDLTGDFDIHEYHDSYGERVTGLIEKKLAGETVHAEPPKKAEAKELMAALEETLAQLPHQ
ncbi:MAG: Ku protein [Methanoregulaceae archaeon]|nr:Ku protein [Methanoregulaceae archaeon]